MMREYVRFTRAFKFPTTMTHKRPARLDRNARSSATATKSVWLISLSYWHLFRASASGRTSLPLYFKLKLQFHYLTPFLKRRISEIETYLCDLLFNNLNGDLCSFAKKVEEFTNNRKRRIVDLDDKFGNN